MGILNKLIKNLFGDGGGPTFLDDDNLPKQFSSFFPWYNYNIENKVYVLKDNSACWIYECSPLIYASEGVYNTIADLFKVTFPEKSILQFCLYSDPYVTDILDKSDSYKKNCSDLFKFQSQKFRRFVEDAAKNGMKQFSGTPVKNFRLFLSIRINIEQSYLKDHRQWLSEALTYVKTLDNIEKIIIDAGIRFSNLEPDNLLLMLYRIFNPNEEHSIKYKWDVLKPIYKQFMTSDNSKITVHKDKIQIGKTYVSVLTPKTYPKNFDMNLIKNLIGYYTIGSSSMADDANQIPCSFIYTLSIIVDSTEGLIARKTYFTNLQKSTATTAQNVSNRKMEAQWIFSQIEEKEKFYKVIPQLTLFHQNADRSISDVNHVMVMWRNLKCELQLEQNYLLKKLFITSFPGGLYNDDYNNLARYHIMPTSTASMLTPIESSGKGLGKPVVLLFDKRGQLFGFGMYDNPNLPNKNFIVTGGAGGGKSFLCNYFVGSFLAACVRVRIIDVGMSYKKLVEKAEGQFIHFANSDIVINFFNVVEPDENGDLNGETMSMLIGIIMAMAYSRTDEQAKEIEMSLISIAVQTVYYKYKKETTVDNIVEFLDTIDQEYFQGDKYKDEMVVKARELAVNLQKYTTKGVYGKYVNGKTNVTFNNDFVDVEMDGTPEELRRVMVLAFTMLIESEIYNSKTRETKYLILLDEAWQTLDNFAAAKFCEGLYRKARKYNASIGIAIQSYNDTAYNGKLGALGSVTRDQASLHFMLPDGGFTAARENKALVVSDYSFYNILQRMPTNSKPNYSEFALYIDQRFLIPLRLVVESYSYFMYTSDANDNVCLLKIETALKDHYQLSYKEASTLSLLLASDIADSNATSHDNGVMYLRQNIDAIIKDIYSDKYKQILNA